MTDTMLQLIINKIIYSAKEKKQLEITYQYLDNKIRRHGYIQPIKWLVGRKGFHILAWDTREDGWRRFAIKNIQEIKVTNEDWVRTDLKEEITDIPH